MAKGPRGGSPGPRSRSTALAASVASVVGAETLAAPPGATHGLKGALVARFGVAGEALYLFVAAAIAIAGSGLMAAFLAQPLLFPSLGPTAYLFFERPHAPFASPRNAIIGHGVAILAGYAALALCGLLHAPGALLILLRAQHPPAGATTLLVSLGVLTAPRDLLALACGVLLLTVVSWAINRACGVRPPRWRAPEPHAGG